MDDDGIKRMFAKKEEELRKAYADFLKYKQNPPEEKKPELVLHTDPEIEAKVAELEKTYREYQRDLLQKRREEKLKQIANQTGEFPKFKEYFQS